MKKMNKNMSRIIEKNGYTIVRGYGAIAYDWITISPDEIIIGVVDRCYGESVNKRWPDYDLRLKHTLRKFKESKGMIKQHLYWAIRHVVFEKYLNHSHIFHEIEKGPASQAETDELIYRGIISDGSYAAYIKHVNTIQQMMMQP